MQLLYRLGAAGYLAKTEKSCPAASEEKREQRWAVAFFEL
jgi:hypothetical protein